MQANAGFFSDSLAVSDPQVFTALQAETRRQSDGIELIASENHVSAATLEALGSPITNKTVEGYPGRRYYGGAEHADVIERLAIARATDLFGAGYANVQPHSGSHANLAVFAAFLQPGARVLSMDLSAGGHLSHGSRANLSGKWMEVHHYGVGENGYLDYDSVRQVALEVRPELIIAGGSAYPRAIDFEVFRSIADEVGARFLADIAHFAGLVATGLHPDPMPWADVVSTTTYKNLRGPRGGLLLWNDDDLTRKLDSAVFPGVQGSVMLNAVAAKAVALGEALRPEFRGYAFGVLSNARTLAASLVEHGIEVLTGGTDTPLLLVDLRPLGLTGAEASDVLERAGLTVNKNGVPGDTQPPTVTSGLRLGTSAGTARGMDERVFAKVGELIASILHAMSADSGVETAVTSARSAVTELASAHPMYP